jgi:serine protease
LTLGQGVALAQSDQVASGLIVKLKPAAQEGALQNLTQAKARFSRLGRLSQQAGYTRVMPWRHINAQTMVLTTPTALTPALQKTLTDRLMATGQVEWVVPNVRQQLAAVPGDPLYAGPSVADSDLQRWWLSIDPFALSQWWLMSPVSGRQGVPNFQAAWNISTGAAQSHVIAVLDTGVANHVDLPVMGAAQELGKSAILNGHDFVSNHFFDKDPTNGWDADATDPGDAVSPGEAASSAFRQAGCGVQDNSWHGTVVAGLIAATTGNNLGVAGANWNARVLPVRVAGQCGADLADIVAGMYWAAGLDIPQAVRQQEQSNAASGGYAAPASADFPPGQATPRAKVVNISFGGTGPCDSLYQQAIDDLKGRGVVVVASAGNEHGGVARPANCRDVVAVAALNRTGFKSTYSNFGPEITVSTVGGDPGPSTDHPDGGAWGSVLGDTMLLSVYGGGAGASAYGFHAGTSYSAPIVSSVISLMLDVNPGLTVTQIIDGLKVSSRPHVVTNLMGACSSSNPGRCICTTTTCGAGILDAQQALIYAQSPSAYNPTRVLVDLRTDNLAVAEAISDAVAQSAQDRTPNPPAATSAGNSSTSAGGGGGGGGALSPWDLLLLPMLGVWAWLNPRRQGLHCLRAVAWR